MFLFALLVIVAAVYTTRKTPEKLVNRDQTEEWKGWMQVQLRKWISHWGQKRKLFQNDITTALHRKFWLSLTLSTETQRIFVASCQTRTQSLFIRFEGERRLGVSLRRARGLMGRDKGKIATGISIFPSSLPMRPRARLNLTPNLLSPPKHINSDWVRVCSVVCLSVCLADVSERNFNRYCWSTFGANTEDQTGLHVRPSFKAFL